MIKAFSDFIKEILFSSPRSFRRNALTPHQDHPGCCTCSEGFFFCSHRANLSREKTVSFSIAPWKHVFFFFFANCLPPRSGQHRRWRHQTLKRLSGFSFWLRDARYLPWPPPAQFITRAMQVHWYGNGRKRSMKENFLLWSNLLIVRMSRDAFNKIKYLPKNTAKLQCSAQAITKKKGGPSLWCVCMCVCVYLWT